MDRNMRNQHPMMSSNMPKRHVSSHHQQQSHHQQHSQSHSMMGQSRDREPIQNMHQHHYHQPQQHQPQPHHQQQQHHQQFATAGQQQNEDLIKYIEDAWHKVQSSVNKVTSDHGPHSGAKYYTNSAEPPVNFQPFDLEGYWGRRMVQNLHLSRNHQ